MSEILYEIIRITDREDNDRLDGRYPIRIGRRCKPILYGCDQVSILEYRPRENEDYKGYLRTSIVQELEQANGILKITTMNSVYYLKELED